MDKMDINLDLDVDFGNIQLPEFDLDIFADGPEDEKQETSECSTMDARLRTPILKNNTQA